MYHHNLKNRLLKDEEALNIAAQRRITEDEERNRRALGCNYIENNYVFKWQDGRPYSPDYISHRLNRLLKKHNLPHIRFHELRHSCASILITLVFSLKDVQEWLGHADIKMTANIYAHLDVIRKKVAASLTSNLSNISGRKLVESEKKHGLII